MNYKEDLRYAGIEVGTKVKGVWGMLIANSYGEISEIENKRVVITWHDDDDLTQTVAQISDLKAKGSVGPNGSPIGIFVEQE